MVGFWARLFNRPTNNLPPFDFARNRFPARKKWPPNLQALTERQQFRFERKFKRRVKYKAVNPEWNNRVKIVTWSLISFIVVYGVLFHDFAQDPMNPRPGEQPFVGIRSWMWGKLGEFYTHTEQTFKGEARGARRKELLGSDAEVEEGRERGRRA